MRWPILALLFLARVGLGFQFPRHWVHHGREVRSRVIPHISSCGDDVDFATRPGHEFLISHKSIVTVMHLRRGCGRQSASYHID